MLENSSKFLERRPTIRRGIVHSVLSIIGRDELVGNNSLLNSCLSAEKTVF